MSVALVERGESPDLFTLWDLLRESGAVTETELRLPADLDFEDYEALGVFFGRVKRTTSWLIGDFILFGESVYGEKYAQAADMTGLAPQTLANYASVCKHIPPSRRRAGVSFSLHQEVAYLTPSEQVEWLDRAEAGGWTKEILRSEMKGIESGLVDDLVDNGQEREQSREEHPDGVPAVQGGFLGEPVPGPIALESAARVVLLSARRMVGDVYMVDAEAMLALKRALPE